jgi:hypothetical protein
MKRKLTRPACLLILATVRLAAEESARSRLEDFRTPILQAHPVSATAPAADREAAGSLAELSGNRPPPRLSLAPAGASLGTEFSTGTHASAYAGSVLMEKQMERVRADWKAQDVVRLERERRAEVPLNRAMYYVFPEAQTIRVGHTEMGGGLINAVKQRNPFCLLDQVFFLWSF